MKRLSKIGIGLGVLVLLVAATQPAHAVCSNFRGFGSGASYVVTPGVDWAYGAGSTNGYMGTTVSPAFTGTFWHVGNADPTIGLGNDSGGMAALGASPQGGWVYTYPNYAAIIQGTWNDGGSNSLIDGCIDAPYAGGPAAQCMAIYLEDINPETGETVFALLTSPADPSLSYDFEQAGGAEILLATLPKATIGNSFRTENPAGVTVDLTSPDLAALAAGFYLDTADECASVAGGAGGAIAGFRACYAVVPRGGEAPASDSEEWVCQETVTPLGGSAQIAVTCEQDVDVFTSYRLVFDTGLESSLVATSSTRLECGPNLAEIPEQRIQLRERPGQPGRQRGR